MRKTHTITLILAIGLVVSLFVLALGRQEPNLVHVTGSYEQEVDPDIARVYVRISTVEDTAQEAEQENAEISNNVMNALREQGYEQIETERFSLQKKEEWDPETRKSEFEGYEMIHVLKVTTDQTGAAGMIVDTAINAGANEIERVVFDLSEQKRSEEMSEALQKASSDAKSRADALASSLNVRLGRIDSVSESNFNYVPYARAEAYDMAGGTQISPGKVSVNAQVSVSYRIR